MTNAVDWKSLYAMLGVFSIIITAITTLSTVYLKYYFKSSLYVFEQELFRRIKEEFSDKQVTEEKLTTLHQQLHNLQSEMHDIRSGYFKDRRKEA